MKQYGNGEGSEGIPFRAFRRFPGDSHCSRAAGTVPDTQTRRRPLTPAPSSEQMEWTQALRCSNEPLVCSGRAVLCLTHLPWLNHNMLSYNLPPLTALPLKCHLRHSLGPSLTSRSPPPLLPHPSAGGRDGSGGHAPQTRQHTDKVPIGLGRRHHHHHRHPHDQ